MNFSRSPLTRRRWLSDQHLNEFEQLLNQGKPLLDAYRVEIIDAGFFKAPRDSRGRNYGGHGVAVAHGLPNGDNIRHNVFPVQLERPHVTADPAKPDLNLVGDAQATVFSNMPVDESVFISARQQVDTSVRGI